MGISFLNPWVLLLLPTAFIFIAFIFFKKGQKTLKGKVSTILRIVSVLFIIFALAGLSIHRTNKNVQIIVLADRSQSMQSKVAEQEEWIKEIERLLPKNYEMAVISFGEDSEIEKSFEMPSFGRFGKKNNIDATDFEQALKFANAYFAKESAKQIFLITDGKDNRGDIKRISSLLETQKTRIDAHVVQLESKGDAQISNVSLPDIVYQNEKFDIVVEIDAEIEKSAVLQLYSGRNLLSEQDVNLQKGNNRFIFKDTSSSTGIVDYRAVLVESGGVIQNNQKSTISKVLGTPKILLVEGADGEGQEIEKMLKATALEVDTFGVGALPTTLAPLQKYDAVVFADVNADDMSPEQVKTLDTYVKNLGRGMVVFGGDNSYALGSYIGSEFEKMLPVDSNVRNKLDMPSLALVLAIDHSGSMSATDNTGRTRLDLALESAQRAVEQLVPTDSIGVIAFDDTAKWVVPLQLANNIEDVNGLIGGIKLGGGTMMYSSIEEAYKALKESDAAIKHLILLTDGQPADSGFQRVIRDMREDDITVSGVAMGADADVALMRALSETGDGRFYHVDGEDNIPAIFAKETQLSTQSYLQSRTFYPEYVEDSSLTESFQNGLPQLDGFLATITKPTAELALQSDNALPILAKWQYGAGQVVSWTSDINGGWSGNFLFWEDSAKFFGGLVTNVLKGDTGQGYLELNEQGGTAKINFFVEGNDEAKTEALVIAPDGTEFSVPMQLEKFGEFSAEFPTDQEGTYVVRVEQKDGDSVINTIEGGLPRGYSPEYDITNDYESKSVNQLLNLSGGQIINSASELFNKPPEKVKHSIDLSVFWLILGLILFFLDIISRRLQWESRVENYIAEKKLARKVAAENMAQMKAEKTATATINVKVNEPVDDVKSDNKKTADKKKKAKQEEDSDMSGELLARRRNKK